VNIAGNWLTDKKLGNYSRNDSETKYNQKIDDMFFEFQAH